MDSRRALTDRICAIHGANNTLTSRYSCLEPTVTHRRPVPWTLVMPSPVGKRNHQNSSRVVTAGAGCVEVWQLSCLWSAFPQNSSGGM